MKFAEYTSSLDALPVPEWIIAERYMYCDNFIYDYMKSKRLDLLSYIRRRLGILIFWLLSNVSFANNMHFFS